MPGEPVEVLSVPAPWLKLAEAVDHLRRIEARVVVRLYGKVLSEVGVSSHYRQLDQLGGKGTTFTVLDDGKPVEL